MSAAETVALTIDGVAVEVPKGTGLVEAGRAEQSELDLLLDVCDRILGHCLCPLGDAAAMPIASYVTKFRDEFQQHVDLGACPFAGSSTLDDLFAPVNQHSRVMHCFKQQHDSFPIVPFSLDASDEPLERAVFDSHECPRLQ